MLLVWKIQGIKKVRKDNKLGVKGVTKRNNKYIARITVDKNLIHLGCF